VSTIQNKDTPTAATASDAAARLIGIHVTLPPLSFWTLQGPEAQILSRLIANALKRRNLLLGNLDLVAFNHQVFGLAKVTSLGIALSTVSGELSEVGLITGAHLAWGDASEGVFRTDRPLPEPCPFQSRIDAFNAWHTSLKNQTQESRAAQIGQLFGEMANFLTKIANRLASPQLPPPAP
jgi:hypothetical protein